MISTRFFSTATPPNKHNLQSCKLMKRNTVVLIVAVRRDNTSPIYCSTLYTVYVCIVVLYLQSIRLILAPPKNKVKINTGIDFQALLPLPNKDIKNKDLIYSRDAKINLILSNK